MHSDQQSTHSETQKIDQAINSIKEKMKLLNYNNLTPPYFLNTLTKFRETHFGKFLKNVKLDGNNSQQIRQSLKIVHYIIENFDDECFDIYSRQLVQPYTRKMFQDNYQFDAVNFKEVNTNYHLQSQIQETLSQAAEWLTQIQVTQDLLARIQLYFKLKIPHIIEKVRLEGLKSQKNTWTGSFMSGVRKLLSFGLRKSSKMVQSTFFTAVAPTALMLSLAIMGGSATLPWKTTMNTKNLITAASIVAVPFILDSAASTVQKIDYKTTLKRWALTFEALADSIRKFNQRLQQNMRDCTLSANATEFQKERTNLQKIIKDLNKNIESVTKFDENKFEQMRERTDAYFREYIQIKEDDWTVVIPKQEINKKAKQQQLRQIKTNKTEEASTKITENENEIQNANKEEYPNL